MKYYHATRIFNIPSIYEKGLLKGIDGGIYLADTPTNASKFLLVRGITDFAILPLEIEDTENIEESYDHSESFFGCKAWLYCNDIPVNKLPKIDDILINNSI